MKDIVLKSRQVIPVHPEIVRLLDGDHTCAIYLEQMLFYDKNEPKDEDGYFPKSKATILRDTALTRYQQDRARARLEQMEWLTVTVEQHNGSQTVYYKLTCQLIVPDRKGVDKL
jgi:hypothetical protein